MEAARMRGLRSLGFWLGNWIDMETISWHGGLSRKAGCGKGLAVGEFSHEQARAECPVGHSRGENARHSAVCMDSGDSSGEVSLLFKELSVY